MEKESAQKLLAPVKKAPEETSETKKLDEHKVSSSFNLERSRKTFVKKPSGKLQRILGGKTLWLTIIILALVGVGFTGMIYYTLNPNLFKAKELYDQPVTNAPVSLYLSIDNPDDETLTFDSSVIVSGKTSPDSNIVIFSNDNATGTTASPFGEFSKVFSLSPGMNIIQVTAYDNAGNSKSGVVKVYYSEDKL